MSWGYEVKGAEFLWSEALVDFGALSRASGRKVCFSQERSDLRVQWKWRALYCISQENIQVSIRLKVAVVSQPLSAMKL